MSIKKIIGFESSCDDTAIGIISTNKEGWNILSDIRKDQFENVKQYGGVVPEVAARTHLLNITNVFNTALETANTTIDEIDAIAYTIGPGLIGSLIIGSHFAFTLAKKLKKTFIPVHHLEAHMLVASNDFPYLCLLISGGHTMIIYAKSFGNYQILCSTLDDAAGEVFDKIGRRLGFVFPAGALVEEEAKKAIQKTILPIPMAGKLSFSFSGLKTALLNMCNYAKPEEVCFTLQETIFQTIKEKVLLASKLTQTNKLVMSGGVASNQRLRQIISEKFNLICPPISLCMDNGIMVAVAGREHLIHNSNCINNFRLSEFPEMSLEDWQINF